MYFPNMAMSNLEAYDSEVIWAFCLSLIFTLFQMFSLLYGLQFKQQLLLTIIGLFCILSNIERQSTWAKELRFETYPYIICCVLAANYIQANLWKIKDSLIKELKSQNENLFETQKLIYNSMQQGIVLISSQYSDLDGEDFKFFNTQIRDNFVSDL
jgi:hypothetical protein